ncbi:HD family hydrolase [bacterium]|nr:HD family hydrolase [candidate division CSSED10-310 bacterium]
MANSDSGRPLPEAYVRLFGLVGTLKRLNRAGWVEHRVPEVESVADHSFRLALMALFTCSGLDREKLVITALLHDLCEAVTGDVTPSTMVSAQRKRHDELKAMQAILIEFDPDGTLLDLWLDFVDGRTPEGRHLAELDKLEMALQALEYSRQGHPGLREFIDYTAERIATPGNRALLEVIMKEMPASNDARQGGV